MSTAYLLAMAVAVPLAGWGADRFGSKRVWMLALAAFFAGSVAGGLSWSAPSLNASRVLAGSRRRNSGAALPTSGLLFFVVMGLMGAMLLVPMYFQMARGDTARHAGLMLAPQGLGAALGIAACASLVDRMRAAPIALAGVVLAVAALACLTTVGPSTDGWAIAAALFVLGLGFGAVVVPATALAYRGLDTAAIPRATSALRIVQQFGASLGVAILALNLQDAPMDSEGNPAAAFGHTFWWAVVLTALAIIPALALFPDADMSEG